MTPEGKVKDMVKQALARLVYPGTTRSAVYSFAPVQNGMGAPGLDFFLCINGVFVAIETKAKDKKPTPRQEVTMDKVDRARGWVFIVDDLDSLDSAIGTICEKCDVELGSEHD